MRYHIVVDSEVIVAAFVNDTPLAARRASKEWVWETGFCIGCTQLDLLDEGGTSVASARLHVTSDDGKLSDAELEHVLQDLLQWAPESISGESQTSLPFGAKGELAANVAYERVKQFAPLFQQALRDCQTQPHSAFEPFARSVPIDRVRRLSRSQLQNSRVAAYTAAAVSGQLSDSCSPSVRAERPQRTLDTLPNRSLWTMAKGILSVVNRIREDIERARCKAGVDERSRYERRIVVLEDIARSMLDTFAWFKRNDIRTNQALASGLAQMMPMPTYKRAVRLNSLLRSSTFDPLSREALLPLNSTWGIYEQWSFEYTCRQIEKLTGLYPQQRLTPLTAGAKAYVFSRDTTRIIIAAQVTFPSGPGLKEGSLRYSLSRERIPDIVLIVTHAAVTTWYVLDAKYRRSKANVLDAMASAHIYRDSLFLQGQRCGAALLLTPGAAFNESWELFTADHWDKFGTGAFANIRPNGEGLETLSSYLAGILRPTMTLATPGAVLHEHSQDSRRAIPSDTENGTNSDAIKKSIKGEARGSA
ncbi:hypothetical protein ACW9YQ_17880 (plasmid) [Paraburkholderia strydomiana]